MTYSTKQQNQKNYKNYFTEWSWFGCGTLKRSDAAVAQPGEQAENCEVWCFIQTSRPTTCTCLVRPPKLLFVVRRTLTKYLHCSRAAVQPISFMTLTRMTNSATCNWVNLMQVSSVELSSVCLLWTRLYCRLVMRLKNDVQIKCSWPCQKAVFCR